MARKPFPLAGSHTVSCEHATGLSASEASKTEKKSTITPDRRKEALGGKREVLWLRVQIAPQASRLPSPQGRMWVKMTLSFFFLYFLPPEGRSEVQSVFEVKAPSDGESNYPLRSRGAACLSRVPEATRRRNVFGWGCSAQSHYLRLPIGALKNKQTKKKTPKWDAPSRARCQMESKVDFT